MEYIGPAWFCAVGGIPNMSSLLFAPACAIAMAPSMLSLLHCFLFAGLLLFTGGDVIFFLEWPTATCN